MALRARRMAVLAALVAGVLVAADAAGAATAPPGAQSCSGCHAMPARADAAIPALAGRGADAIAEAMLGFQRGEGSPTVMDRIARGFTEPEIRAIAAWIAGR